MAARWTLAAALGVLPLAAPAGDCTDDAMIVFDGSGSMSEMGFNNLGEPRIFEARRAVRQALPGIAPFRRLGLIVYGPGDRAACQNIDLRFGPRADAAGPVIDAVDALAPAGNTPLTQAVMQAAQVLDYRARPGTVVLITDGKETCGGAPCQLAAALAADSADLTVHVIGFKVRGDHFGWATPGEDGYEEAVSVARCLADTTGGHYVNAETVDELVAALQVTLGCPLFGKDGAPVQALIRGRG